MSIWIHDLLRGVRGWRELETQFRALHASVASGSRATVSLAYEAEIEAQLFTKIFLRCT